MVAARTLRRASAAATICLLAWLVPAGPGAALDRVPSGTQVLKGEMKPSGSIRFQALPSKRSERPRLDRFRLKYTCLDGTTSGMSYGAWTGAPIRPNAKGRFRIADEGSQYAFILTGDFNGRYTKATGTFRFEGDLVTSEDDVHCVTGKLSWRAKVQPKG